MNYSSLINYKPQFYRVTINQCYAMLIFSALLITFTSCEEDFNPKTEFKQKYVLNCIIRGDTSFQTATVLQSYPHEEINSSYNYPRTFVKAEEVKLWVENRKVYFFRDTIHIIEDSQFIYYYIDNFEIVAGDSLKLRAVMPNGEVLWAWTRMPNSSDWNIAGSDSIIPVVGKPNFIFSWFEDNYNSWYLLKLFITYRKESDPENVRKTEDVPIKIKNDDNKISPEFPGPFRSGRIVFHNEGLIYAMEKISQNDPNKSNYIIYGAKIELLVFDRNLSIYYSNSKGYLDDYTIRVDQTDFTNINGGFGIFGSYFKQVRGIRIDREFIKSFGYIPAN